MVVVSWFSCFSVITILWLRSGQRDLRIVKSIPARRRHVIRQHRPVVVQPSTLPPPNLKEEERAANAAIDVKFCWEVRDSVQQATIVRRNKVNMMDGPGHRHIGQTVHNRLPRPATRCSGS
uniref:Uncharacterized protein n=1 Tax=mine drainage metagenome TaxID=410659 RepID=E6QV25_9ZZZZ